MSNSTINRLALRKGSDSTTSKPGIKKMETGVFAQPASFVVPHASSNLFKSSSCQNIKGNSRTGSRSSSRETSQSTNSNSNTKLHHSSNNLAIPTKASKKPTHVSKSTGILSKSVPSSTINVPVLRNNARVVSRNDDRITVNSDLLSRVEKEKKQYELRISELIHLTETRKMEIEKLSFEVRDLKQAKEDALALARCAQSESSDLLQNAGDSKPIEAEMTRSVSSIESLGTTTRMSPELGTSSVTSNCQTTSLSSLSDDPVSLSVTVANPAAIRPPGQSTTSVANLQGRIHEMEEANYTTVEELQATMEELCDLQRNLDNTQEDNRTLAYERAILLESLCTQTSKLEHCRLQISQLKYLLVNTPDGSNVMTRERHFIDLYNSVEEEKQLLLGQNNDLAQSSDSLAQECRLLTERVGELNARLICAQEEREALQTACKALPVKSSSVSSESIPPHADDLWGEERMVLEARILATEREVEFWRDKCELAQSDHEKDATEWRLYERDLLKTVRVADGIKAESEEELARMAVENHQLREQVDKLTAEIAQLNLTRQTPPSTVNVGVNTPSVPLSAPRLQHPMSSINNTVNNLPVATSISSDSKVSSRKASLSSCTSSCASASGIFTPKPVQYQHRSTYLQQLGLSASPGGPCSKRAGPTVQSLIQTIENQVKAVHQQKLSQSRGASPPISLSNGIVASRKSSSGYQSVTGSVTGSSDLASTHPPRVQSAGNSPTSTPLRSSAGGDGVNRSTSPESISSLRQRRRLGLPDSDQEPPGGPPPVLLSPGARSSNSPDQFPAASSGSRCKQLFASPKGDSSLSTQLKFSASPPAQTGPGVTVSLKRHTTTVTSSIDSPSRQRGTLPSTSGGGIVEAVSSLLSAAAAVQEGNDLESTNGGSDLGGQEDNPPLVSSSTESSETAVAAVVNVTAEQNPLQELAKRTNAGSKRNALLRWCQSRIAGFKGVEVTNFSSSWNDGLALCALLHTYLPLRIAWDSLIDQKTSDPYADKQHRFEIAFAAAEDEGIVTTLCLQDMLTKDRPDWTSVMAYITAVYKHFEVDSKPSAGVASSCDTALTAGH